jgi:hypothetical protein
LINQIELLSTQGPFSATSLKKIASKLVSWADLRKHKFQEKISIFKGKGRNTRK